MITDPTWIFFIVVCIIFSAPMIFSKLRIPHLVGMILAGVVVGEHGLNLLQRDASFEMFGKVGIYFIMFLAGLEMNMQNLKQNRLRGVAFGTITTVIPFLFGLFSGLYLLNYSIEASLLLACIFASHTLVSYSIVGRYGVTNDPSVTVSVLATMIALLSALLFLAGMSGVIKGDGIDALFWIFFILRFGIFILFMFWVLPRIIRVFFRKFSDPIMLFTFTIAVVFLSAAMAAELCGLEGIFGAFLAGLVLNRFIPSTSPLMNRLEFVAGAIFIPYFLIGVGMLVNVRPLFYEGNAAFVVLVMVVAGTVSKYLAAAITRRLFRWNRYQGLMMFGLTEAHAAGALAMVLVGTHLKMPDTGEPLMSGAVLDGVVVTILISCIISSIITDQASKGIKMGMGSRNASERRDSTALDDEKILIPLNNLDNVPQIMDTAFMMRNRRLNRGLICLNIINDSDLTEEAKMHSQECLGIATQLASAADVPIQTKTRLAVNFVMATIHSFYENDASEILIGLHHRQHTADSFFGTFASGLIDGIARQISIVNLQIPANTLRKIVVAVPPKAQYERGYYRWINRVARMAEDLRCVLEFYTSEETAQTLIPYMRERHSTVRAEYESMEVWTDLPSLRYEINADHLLVVVAARRGSMSWNASFNKLSVWLSQYFSKTSLLVIYPDQQAESEESFLSPKRSQQQTLDSGSRITTWLSQWITKAT